MWRLHISGNRIYFAPVAGGIYEMDYDGSNLRCLCKGKFVNPTYLNNILYIQTDDTYNNIYKIDLLTSKKKKVTSGLIGVYDISFIEGEWLYYRKIEKFLKNNLYKVNNKDILIRLGSEEDDDYRKHLRKEKSDTDNVIDGNRYFFKGTKKETSLYVSDLNNIMDSGNLFMNINGYSLKSYCRYLFYRNSIDDKLYSISIDDKKVNLVLDDKNLIFQLTNNYVFATWIHGNKIWRCGFDGSKKKEIF